MRLKLRWKWFKNWCYIVKKIKEFKDWVYLVEVFDWKKSLWRIYLTKKEIINC